MSARNNEGTNVNETSFRAELQTLINRHSRENDSGTPDFVLADYMADCLAAYDKAVTRRNEWHKLEPRKHSRRVRDAFDTLPDDFETGDC